MADRQTSPTSSTPIAVATVGAGLLLAAFLAATALVPDQAIVRSKVVWSRGFLLGAAALVLLVQGLRGRLTTPWPLFLGLSFLPAGFALLHLLHTPVASAAVARDEIERLLLLPLSFWAAANLLVSPEARHRLMPVLAVCGGYVGGFAVAQRIGGLVPLGIDPEVRAVAGFGNPVFLGAWLVLVTPLLAIEALVGKGWARWLSAVATGLCLAAMLSTQSVGTWMGFGVAMAVGLMLLVPRRRVVLGTLGVLALAATILLFSNLGAVQRQRAHSLIWRDTLSMIADHPAGVGPGQYQLAFLPYASEELLEVYPRATVIINDAHCEALQLIAELGWAGFGAVLLVCVALIRALRRTLQSSELEAASDAPRAAGAMAAIAGCLAQSFVSPDLRFTVSTMVLGTLLGFVASYAPAAAWALPFGRVGRRGLALASVVALGLVTADTWDRQSLGALLRPADPFRPSPELAARIVELRRKAAQLPNDPETVFDLGVALGDAHHFRDSAKAFRRVLELTPNNLSVIRNLGTVEWKAGQFHQAVEHLRFAVESDPQDLQSRYALAYSSYGRGDVRTALIELESLLAMAPDHVQARLLLEKLRE